MFLIERSWLDDGITTFVQATDISTVATSPTSLSIKCVIPPSPYHRVQRGRMYIGYSFKYRYSTSGVITYKSFEYYDDGVHFNYIRNGQLLYLNGNMDASAYSGTNTHMCTTTSCVCRFVYNVTSGIDTLSSPIVYYSGFNAYSCLVNVTSSARTSPISVVLALNGFEVSLPNPSTTIDIDNTTAIFTVRYVQSGGISSVLAVEHSGFFASNKMLCGFSRFKDGEAPATPGGRPVSCGAKADNVISLYSRPAYVNATHIGCLFDNFIYLKTVDNINTVVNDTLSSDDILCYNGYYIVSIGNHIDDMTVMTHMYQYISYASALAADPSFGSKSFIESINVIGRDIARIGVPSCWWVQFVSDGIIPSDQNTVPDGLFSQIINGSFVQTSLGPEVRCPLPDVNNILKIAVVISNNGVDYNYSSFATFRFLTSYSMSLITAPSNLTYNKIPLNVQPVVMVTDIEGTSADVIDIIDVTIKTVPDAVGISGNIARVRLGTPPGTTQLVALAAYTDLRIEGKQVCSLFDTHALSISSFIHRAITLPFVSKHHHLKQRVTGHACRLLLLLHVIK